MDENYFDLLLSTTLAQTYNNGYDETMINNHFTIVHMPAENFRMCGLGKYPYHVYPTMYTLNSMLSQERSQINLIQNNPSLALFGQGVLIGLIDTGIDYQHQAFLHPDGTTRIYSLWDQTMENGSPPADFSLGTEYDQSTINFALQEPDPMTIVPSVDENGHGTMLAGIAAGSRNEFANFSGVAPEAELVIVKLATAKRLNKHIFNIPEDALCYPESNILLGIEYLRSVALTLNRPLIVCIGLGSSQGDHSGHGALSTTVNELATATRMGVCVAAGNEGNSRRHYRGLMSAGENVRDFELRIGPNDTQFSMEIWQKSPSRLTIDLYTPTGERIRDAGPTLRDCREFSFIIAPTTVIINNSIIEVESGEQLIQLRFENAVSGIWRIRATNIDNITGYFDAWLPSGGLISEETYFLEPDPYITVTAPGNARYSFTVTAYNELDNSILPSSSRGYTSGNEEVPDLAAPGFALTCPLPSNRYGSATGTGAAAAHTAGIMAMLMEWAVLRGNYTATTGRDINRFLIRGARRASNMVYPNPIWGYGQVDILGAFQSLL